MTGHSTLGNPGGKRIMMMLMKGIGSLIGDDSVCDYRQHGSQEVQGSSLFFGCRGIFYRITCMNGMYCYVLVADNSDTSLGWLSPAWLSSTLWPSLPFPAEIIGDAGTYGIPLCIQKLESAGS